jgi:hypothetical protein
MARYRAIEPIYICSEGRYIQAGDEFVSEIIPGPAWEPLDDDAKAAVAALTAPPVPDAAPAAKSAKATT